MALTETVFNTIAPKRTHIHVHTEKNSVIKYRRDLTQPFKTAWFQRGLDRCGVLLISSKKVVIKYQNYSYLKHDSVLI